MPRSRRLPGTPASKSYRKPVCSQGHPPEMIRREPEGWVCFGCVDDFRRSLHESKTESGIVLPAGQEAQKDFHPTQDIVLNRRQRRRMRGR